MNKILMLLVFFLVLLTLPFSLPAYEGSPDNMKVIPECIWAAATGGGTWMTEIQVTSLVDYNTVYVYFYYGGGNYRGPFALTTIVEKHNSVKFSNILQTIDSLDSGAFTYYGKVGAVSFWTIGVDNRIRVTAKTINGNFGKTFPGLNIIAGTTAAFDRNMVIPCLSNNSAYRTFTGFFNTSGTATYSVNFAIISATNLPVGAIFTRSFKPYEYMAFNPFVLAGVGSGAYDNCWLLVVPVSGGSDSYGIMCYGAIANNTSNDPSALIASPYN